MKKTIKAIFISICMFTIMLVSNGVYATTAGEIKDEADKWINSGAVDAPIKTSEAWEVLAPVGKILVSVAGVILVICYMYLGIKYMMADPSGKADVKQRLIWLVIATVIIYGGIGIFTIVVNLMNSILG